MGDVVFGYVYDFGTGEEWTADARRRRPAQRRAARRRRARRTRSRSSPSKGRRARRSRPASRRSSASAQRLRVMGSLALSLCQLAAGRVDARLLAEAGALGRHRGCAAARARAGSRDRAARRTAVRRCPARPRSALAGRAPLRRRRAAPSSLPLCPARPRAALARRCRSSLRSSRGGDRQSFRRLRAGPSSSPTAEPVAGRLRTVDRERMTVRLDQLDGQTRRIGGSEEDEHLPPYLGDSLTPGVVLVRLRE